MDKVLQQLGESDAVENSYFMVEQSRKALEGTEKAYQESFERFKKQKNKLAQVLAEMKKCEMAKTDFETAQNMPVKRPERPLGT